MEERKQKRRKVEKCDNLSPPEKDNKDINVRRKKNRRRKLGETEEPKRRVKKRFKQDVEIQNQMDSLHDDIVTVDSNQVEFHQQNLTSNEQPEHKIFVQLPRGFKEMKLKESDVVLNDTFNPIKPQSERTKKLDLALYVQNSNQKLISLLHGLITGIALWECVVISFMRPPFFSHDDFASYFSLQAPLVQSVFLIVLVTCLVDVLDSGDVVRMKGNLISFLFIESSSIPVIVLYIISFIITLLTCDVETRYSEYFNPNITNSTEWMVSLDDHETWWILTLFRALCLLLSYVILTFWTPTKRLVNLLSDIRNENTN